MPTATFPGRSGPGRAVEWAAVSSRGRAGTGSRERLVKGLQPRAPRASCPCPQPRDREPVPGRLWQGGDPQSLVRVRGRRSPGVSSLPAAAPGCAAGTQDAALGGKDLGWRERALIGQIRADRGVVSAQSSGGCHARRMRSLCRHTDKPRAECSTDAPPRAWSPCPEADRPAPLCALGLGFGATPRAARSCPSSNQGGRY